MKLTFSAEDAIIGIICGLLLIGFTGRWFSLKLHNFVYVAAFAIFIIFIILDILHELSDLARHFGLIGFSILHNLVDLAISLTFISHFSGWNIPYITSILVPYLKDESMIFYVGIFLVFGNAIWLVIFPFAEWWMMNKFKY